MGAEEAAVGFSIHSEVLSDWEVAQLRGALADIGRTRAGARHLMALPVVAAAASDPRLLQLAQGVLGRIAVPFRATLFDKAPGSNWLVVWHQDTALPVRCRADHPEWGPWSTKAGVIYAHAPASALEQVVALRLHLDGSTSQNGPLRVIPASHKSGVLSDEALRVLAQSNPSLECVVGVGGVLRMRPLLVHSSSKALTPHRRRVLHIEYTASRQLECGLELDVA